jgi:peptide/nickel transport system permease protein
MMIRIVRRLASSLLVLWLAVSGTFLLAHAIPADPARAAVGPHADAATVERVRHQMCLDRPFVVQYGCFVGRIAKGDLGTSFRTRRPVTELLIERFVPTAQLALAAVALSVLFGVSLGVLGAVKRRRAQEKVMQAAALVGQSAPTFFLGPLFIYVFAYRLGLFPVTGYGEPGWDRLMHLALPALTLAVGGIAYYARVVRADMIGELDRDYVRTARAKGTPEGRVIVRHALRNVLAPVVTLVGLDIGVLLGGAAITETVFAWPGLGREAVLGVVNLDLPVVLGVVLLVSVAISAMSLIVDIAYPILDPRVRAGSAVR